MAKDKLESWSRDGVMPADTDAAREYDDWTQDPRYGLTPRKPRVGLIPGLKKLAGDASSIFELFHGAKKLAKADDTHRAQEALEQMKKA